MKNTIILLFIICLLIFGCTKNEDDTETSNSLSKIFSIESVFDGNTSYQIVQLDIQDGLPISVVQSIPYQQGRIDYDLAYSSPTDELLIRESVYENNLGEGLIRVNLESNTSTRIKCDYFSNMICTPSGRIFGIKPIREEENPFTLISVDIVEIDIDNGEVISTLESFKPLEEAPENDKTGVNYILFSKNSNEILIPRRVEFYSDSIDNLLKINIDTREKTILNTNNYERIISGNKGRLFALKYMGGTLELIELDKNSGKEKEVLLTDLNWSSTQREIFYLSETNDIVLYDDGFEGGIIKFNLDSKQRTDVKIERSVAVRGFTMY